jgi:hypothetical protein
MIDIEKVVRDYLVTVPAITALTGDRIYASRDVPPPGYRPQQGHALVYKVRGGTITSERSAIVNPSLQFKCYGLTEADAADLYLALVDALEGKHPGAVRMALTETLGQPLEEPDTHWRYVLSFFKLTALRSGS